MSEEKAVDSYRSISSPSTGLYKEFGSKFLSFAYPVVSEEEVKDILSNLRSEYFDARHHCYAYRLGLKGELWRVNDDGEPSSSAGRPIMGQILSNELSDILIVVVRYFGGTKLGIPGLIKAYKTASSDAIENALIIDKVASKSISFGFDYINMEAVMKMIKSNGIDILSQNFDLRCRITVNIRLSEYEAFRKNLLAIEGVDFEI
jgi:Uncharacterized conserved protein